MRVQATSILNENAVFCTSIRVYYTENRYIQNTAIRSNHPAFRSLWMPEFQITFFVSFFSSIDKQYYSFVHEVSITKGEFEKRRANARLFVSVNDTNQSITFFFISFTYVSFMHRKRIPAIQSITALNNENPMLYFKFKIEKKKSKCFCNKHGTLFKAMIVFISAFALKIPVKQPY